MQSIADNHNVSKEEREFYSHLARERGGEEGERERNRESESESESANESERGERGETDARGRGRDRGSTERGRVHTHTTQSIISDTCSQLCIHPDNDC